MKGVRPRRPPVPRPSDRWSAAARWLTKRSLSHWAKPCGVERAGVPHAAQDDDREHEREPEGEVADARLGQRGGRLALLEPRDRVRRRVLALDGAATDEPGRDEARDARDDDRGEEQPDDQDDLRERARERDQVDEVAHWLSRSGEMDR